MFNTLSIRKLSFILGFLCSLFIISCKKEKTLNFSEISFLEDQETIVEINIPKVESTSNAANLINETLKRFTCKALHVDAATDVKETFEESITGFNDAYKNFTKILISEFSDEFPQWQALIDGEIIYLNQDIVSIAMNSSINTGSPSSRLVLKFFNFNLKTGQEMNNNDLISNTKDFTELAKKYYKKELLTSFNNDNLFPEVKDFKLPDNLGFSDEGVIILLYNFNLGQSENDILEFTIPYEVANDYLNF